MELNIKGSIINGAASMATALLPTQPLFAFKNFEQLGKGRPPLKSWWAGYGANAGSGAPAEGAAFVTYHLGQKILGGDDEHKLTPAANLILSASSGIGAAPINASIEHGMIRQQIEPSKGFFVHMNQIYKEAGFLKGVFKGTGVTAIRDAFFNVGVFFLNDTFREKLKASIKDPIQRDFAAGIGAGVIAGALSNPFDLCKTRMQANNSPENRTFRQVFKTVIATEGIAVLFRGTPFRSLTIGSLVCLTAFFKDRYPQYFPNHLKA